MRTACISYREFNKKEWESFSAEHNQWAEDSDRHFLDLSDMTMIGIFAFGDPLRPGISEVVDKM